MEKIAFVVNPVSGDDDGYRNFAAATEALRDRGVHVASFETDPDEGSRPAAEEALEAGYRELWVIGGDGTIQGCLGPIVEAEAILGALPGGTANRFVGAIGPHAGDVRAHAEWMMEQPVERVDLGECNGELFSVHVGVGFEAAAAEETEDEKSGLGSVAYLVAGFRALRDVEPQEVILRSAGEVLYEGPMLTALFFNLPFASLMKAAQGIVGDPIDGLLIAKVIAEAPGWRSLIRWLTNDVGEASPPTIFSHSAAEYQLELERDALTHVDGEMIGRHRSLELRCHRRALRVRGLEVEDEGKSEK